MRTAEFIERCIAGGMPLSMALSAAKAFEVECSIAVDLALEDVRAKARERQARSRLSRDKAGMSRDAKGASPVTFVTPKPEMSRDKRDPLTRVEDNLLTTEVTGLTIAVVEARANDEGDWPKGDAKDHAAELIELSSTSKLDMSRQPGLVLTMGRIHQWRCDGASWRFDVVPVVTTLAKKKTGPPISSWKFFDAAIAQSIADNRKALSIPEASHERPNTPAAKRSAREDNLGRGYRVAMAIAGS